LGVHARNRPDFRLTVMSLTSLMSLAVMWSWLVAGPVVAQSVPVRGTPLSVAACRTQPVAAVAPSTRPPGGGCWLTDGNVADAAPEGVVACVASPLQAPFGIPAECAMAPITGAVLTLERVEPLLGLRAAAASVQPDRVQVRTSNDGVHWQDWIDPFKPATGTLQRFGSQVVWAKYVELRPVPLFESGRQPLVGAKLDARGRAILGTRTVPLSAAFDPAVRPRTWTGTLATLSEVQVLRVDGPGASGWQLSSWTPTRVAALLLACLCGTGLAVVLSRKVRRRTLTSLVWASQGMATALAGLTLLMLLLSALPILGLLFLAISRAVAVLGLAALVVGTVALPRGARGMHPPLLGALVFVADLILVGALDRSPHPVPDAATAPRDFPTAASPVSVVSEELKRLTSRSLARDRRRACGLLAARVRKACNPPRLGLALTAPVRLVLQHADRAVVSIGQDSTGLLLVRLTASPQGWSMLDLPADHVVKDCVVAEVLAGRDGFRCPT
jgi:hypothetical protein